jgi:hypothetical protein
MHVGSGRGHGGREFGAAGRIVRFFSPARRPVGSLYPGEHGDEGVVVALRHRIDLVVVAPGAVDRHAAGGGHHLRDHVVEIVGAGLPPQHVALRLHLADEVPRAGRQEAGGDHVLGIVGGEHVAGDLPPQKLVVGQVVVESVDHPVAIPPGIGPQLVTLEAVRVGVVGDVEPVAGPAFAVMWRGEQAVDESLVGVG